MININEHSFQYLVEESLIRISVDFTMGLTYSHLVAHGNPVLNYFGGYVVQPYWIIIVQLLFIQMLQRLHSKYGHFKEKEQRNILLPLEVLFLGKEKLGGNFC